MMEVLGIDRRSLPIILGRRIPVRDPDRIGLTQTGAARSTAPQEPPVGAHGKNSGGATPGGLHITTR
jgi:hypothetical protein